MKPSLWPSQPPKVIEGGIVGRKHRIISLDEYSSITHQTQHKRSSFPLFMQREFVFLCCQLIPMPVLYGVFLYMGLTALGGVQVK